MVVRSLAGKRRCAATTVQVCANQSPAAKFCVFGAGLFTSPHLFDIRERIRLDGEPIAEDKYLTYFWEVWDKLAATKVRRPAAAASALAPP